MQEKFFDQPILNSPYEYPSQHWELDGSGQPTHKILSKRRRAEFITPIPKPRKRKKSSQKEMVFDEGKGMVVFNSSNYLEIAVYKSNPETVGSASSLMGLELRDTVSINFLKN